MHIFGMKPCISQSCSQAALAENESNCRLVEWQEKSAEMERGRAELEDAYVKLTGYYEQLQEAYNALYASAQAQNVGVGAQTDSTDKVSEIFISIFISFILSKDA